MKYISWYRRTAAFMSLVLFFSFFSLKVSAEETWPEGPSIVGESGILMEVSTGTILYSKNVHQQYYPASITKILTALLVLENCDLNEWVTIPHDAVYMDEDKGSHIALDEDEVVRVEDLLYALMLASANDAAYALAVHTGGSIEGFAEMMNQKAEELGCQDSHFVNPHGLPNDQHLTSAYDMALITREALKSDVFREIAGTLFYEIPPSENQPDLIPMSQHHDMLTGTRYHYEGAFVGKTGYTTVAKNTLVTCAGREGVELICVTMKTEGKQVYKDTAALFDFGFEAFQKLDVAANTTGSLNAAVFDDGIKTEDGMELSGSGSLQPVAEIAIPVQMNETEYVVLPKEAAFSDLTAEVHYDPLNCEPGSVCLLTFSYGGKNVGIGLAALPQELAVESVPETESEPEESEAADQNENKEETAEKGKFRWWYIPVGMLILVPLSGIGFLVIRRIIWQRRWRKRRRRGRMPGYSNKRSKRRDYY